MEVNKIKYITCPWCGRAFNKEGDNTMENKCPHCGKEIKERANFCSQCGKGLKIVLESKDIIEIDNTYLKEGE